MSLSDQFSRRDLLRIGAISFAGSLISSSAAPLPADIGPAVARSPSTKRCIFLMLQGGPSHIDLWDPKPAAGEEIRGPFQTISTKVPGVAFGELLSRQATIADEVAVIRSMTHQFTNHIAGTYITLTGSTNQPDRDREAHADDFPGPGAILNHLRPSLNSIPTSVSLPNWLSIPGPSNRMPGQYGGFLGSVCHPFLVEGDPNQADFNPLSLKLAEGMSIDRLDDRRSLLSHLDQASRWLDSDRQHEKDRLRHSAYELVSDGRIRDALQLGNVSDAQRDRYGRNQLGQSFLLAKRLATAGVQWVGYNEFNQKWDTHGGLQGRYQQIVPPLDQAYTALIEDLKSEGLLDETIVVLAGEFGRTPRVNGGAGRDHWPNAYSIVLAGGGVQGGAVIGSTDSQGGEVQSHAVSPADVLATTWHVLGLDPQTTIYDRLRRPHLVSDGRVLTEILS